MRSKVRRTARLAEAQTEIGMVLGGEAGARLSRRLSMPVSGDTVMRLIRRRRPTQLRGLRASTTGLGGADDALAPPTRSEPGW